MGDGATSPDRFPKRRQIRKHQTRIHEISETLMRNGHQSVNQQARALNLPRSTAWTILRANHKNSGLTVKVLRRMLNSPELPVEVREMILQYLREKAAGHFGGSKIRQRRFKEKLLKLGLIPNSED